MKKLIQYKLNNLMLIVLVITLAIDFFDRIYVKVPQEQRSVTFAELKLATQSLPYSPSAVATLSEQWVSHRSDSEFSEQQSSLVKDINNYDSLKMAGFHIALLAIYGSSDVKALLWMKDDSSQVEELVRVQAEQEFKGIAVLEVNKDYVILKHQEIIHKLQLFKPSGKSQTDSKFE